MPRLGPSLPRHDFVEMGELDNKRYHPGSQITRPGQGTDHTILGIPATRENGHIRRDSSTNFQASLVTAPEVDYGFRDHPDLTSTSFERDEDRLKTLQRAAIAIEDPQEHVKNCDLDRVATLLSEEFVGFLREKSQKSSPALMPIPGEQRKDGLYSMSTGSSKKRKRDDSDELETMVQGLLARFQTDGNERGMGNIGHITETSTMRVASGKKDPANSGVEDAIKMMFKYGLKELLTKEHDAQKTHGLNIGRRTDGPLRNQGIKCSKCDKVLPRMCDMK
jgi:hypothetical protein